MHGGKKEKKKTCTFNAVIAAKKKKNSIQWKDYNIQSKTSLGLAAALQQNTSAVVLKTVVAE